MPQTIKAIIFDLGRVLVNIDNTFLVETFFRGFDADDLQELGRRTMSDPAMVEFNTGRMPPEEFYRRMCDTYHLELDYDTFKEYWCKIFIPMDDMEHLVGSIGPDITVGLLSDTDPLHWNHVKTTWPWIGAIDNPTLSYKVGVMKPDKKIFSAAAANVQTGPQQCLFIDDLQTNVDGARAAGMQAVRFVNVPDLAAALSTMGLLKTQH